MKYSFVFVVALVASVAAQNTPWGQCGGQYYSGPTSCPPGWVCVFQNPYYSQCLAGPSSSSIPVQSTTLSTATSTSSSIPPSTSPTSPPSTCSKTQFAGVNIAGFDFGCGTDGTCNQAAPNGPYPPIAPDGPDGAGQMNHFVQDDGLNIFRLPVGWQYLVASNLGGPLSSSNFGTYDTLVQSCLATGAHCLIDIHNYARWDGAIVGQGGPTNDQLANVWSQLATYYANTPNIIFGIMNEPHDIPSISTWAGTVQACVTAIRNAGANTQIILLPGNDYTSAQQFISDGSLAALQTVTNPDGTTTGLVFDIHKYLDSDNSGTNAECVTDNISTAFQPLAAALRAVGRQALLSETGGGNTASCEQDLCQEFAYLNQNCDVYLGYIGWAAGSFATTYTLSETPTYANGVWTDQPLVQQCLKR